MLGAHKPEAMKNMISANMDLDTSKLYMDDDQMKHHKQHQQKLEKTRVELRNKISKVDKTMTGVAHYNEIRKIEDQYKMEVANANRELSIKLNLGTP